MPWLQRRSVAFLLLCYCSGTSNVYEKLLFEKGFRPFRAQVFLVGAKICYRPTQIIHKEGQKCVNVEL